MQPFNLPILSTLLLTCVFASVLIGLLPSAKKSTEEIAIICRNWALGFSGLILLLSFTIFHFDFSSSAQGLQLVETYQWLGHISYFKLGVDSLSVSMVLLLALLLPVVILASHSAACKGKAKLYYSLLFLLVASVFGVFLAQDMLFFFVFWELELLPMYLLISIWGGQNRLKAANKFLLFTFTAGAFLLAGILLLFFLSHADPGKRTFLMLEASNSFRALQSTGILSQSPAITQLIFILFLIGFCIKLPSIPLHTWLPEAHVEAPTAISMLLAGILLKMGGYGLIRFGTEFFPQALSELAPWIGLLGAINIVGAAIFCLVQDDMKRVIAYSSVSHMGFVLLGLATLSSQGINGAIFQMFSHGIISAGLFAAIGVIYDRGHTRLISNFSGLALRMPVFFFLFLGLAMANLGLPALSGFVGESMIFYATFTSGSNFSMLQLATLIGTIGVVITAAYMLWLGKRLFFGEEKPQWQGFSDLNLSERMVLGSLFTAALLLGVLPRLLTDKLETGSNYMSEMIASSASTK